MVMVMQVGKPDMEEQMMKLQPVLEKLRNLDPKTFGLLNNMMDQAQATSLLQVQGRMDPEDRLEKLGPILDKLKTLDPKTAQMLSKMVGGESFLQVSGDVDPVTAEGGFAVTVTHVCTGIVILHFDALGYDWASCYPHDSTSASWSLQLLSGNPGREDDEAGPRA